MPRFIVKLEDKKKNKEYFLLWSTIVDGAVDQFDTKDKAITHLKNTLSSNEVDNAIKALETNGVSNPHYSIEDIIDCNDENCSSVEELIEYYCE